jgi:hypothetical protein
MKKLLLLSFALVGFLVSCDSDGSQDVSMEQSEQKSAELKMVEIDLGGFTLGKSNGTAFKGGSDFLNGVTELNEKLAAHGLQLEKMEVYSADAAGQTVFFSDRGNKQLASDYVPNDPRNIGGTTVPFIIDGTEKITSTGFDTEPALLTVRETWENVTCSDGLEIPYLGNTPFDAGYVQNLFGFGGSPGFFPGAIVQAGVLPQAFFDFLGGGTSILGVCFTLTYIEDINGDGTGDVALKEIYYNDFFDWQDRVATGEGFDFQTVALHETGHALSQAHFGKVSRTDKNGKIHFSPRAVMNAGYSGVNRVIAKTDRAGHCSNWGNWPNN